jgi:hypothetical protein
MEKKKIKIEDGISEVNVYVNNGYGYDQWRITSIKLSKYDTE